MSWLVSFTVVLGQTVNMTVSAEINTEAVIPCSIATYDYPGWSVTAGDLLTQYNWDRDSSFITNNTRLSWAANNRNLLLSNVVREDAGKYHCVVNGAGQWTVQLNITGIAALISLDKVYTLNNN